MPKFSTNYLWSLFLCACGIVLLPWIHFTPLEIKIKSKADLFILLWWHNVSPTMGLSLRTSRFWHKACETAMPIFGDNKVECLTLLFNSTFLGRASESGAAYLSCAVSTLGILFSLIPKGDNPNEILCVSKAQIKNGDVQKRVGLFRFVVCVCVCVTFLTHCSCHPRCDTFYILGFCCVRVIWQETGGTRAVLKSFGDFWLKRIVWWISSWFFHIFHREMSRRRREAPSAWKDVSQFSHCPKQWQMDECQGPSEVLAFQEKDKWKNILHNAV